MLQVDIISLSIYEKSYIYLYPPSFVYTGFLSAQMYMRTRNNIGVVANYNFSLNDALNEQAISMGITRLLIVEKDCF